MNNSILQSTTNKNFVKHIKKEGQFNFNGDVVYFKIKNEVGFKTSPVKTIIVEETLIKVTTNNSEYIFEKLS